MAISTLTTEWHYVATGGQTVFPYTNKIYETNDLIVFQNGVLKVEGVGAGQYAVSGAGVDAGGNVTLVTGATVGDLVDIYSAIELTQPVPWMFNSNFPEQDIEDGLDKLTRIIQQVKSQLDNLRLAKLTGTLQLAGAGFGKLAFKAGTTAGTLKLVAISGTSATEVTIADNIGAGN